MRLTHCSTCDRRSLSSRTDRKLHLFTASVMAVTVVGSQACRGAHWSKNCCSVATLTFGSTQPPDFHATR